MSLLKRYITKYVAVFTAMIGFVGMLGWFFDVHIFKTIFPSMIAMKFNTVLSFFLLGISLFFHTNDKFRIIVKIVLIFVSLIGLLTLLEYIYAVNLRIDEFFWKDVNNPVATSNPGRMSPATAFGFLMIGIALMFVRNKKMHLYVQIALFLAFLMAFHGLSNFIFGYGFYKSTVLFSKIALITAITLIVLSIGVLYSPYLDTVRYTFEQKLIFGFSIVMSSVFILFFIYNKSKSDFVSSRDWIIHTQKVIDQSHEILSKIEDVELGKRGYVITGDTLFLEPFVESKKQISNYLINLKLLTRDNHSQQLRFNTLERLISREMAFFKNVIELRSNKGFEEAKKLVATAKGKVLMDSIRNTIADIQKEERFLLNERGKTNQNSIDSANSFISFFQIMIVSFLIALFLIALETFRTRQKAQNLLQKSNERFSKIFNYSPVAMVITSIDEGEFMYANDLYCETTGYKREDLIGKKVVDFNMISVEQRREVHQKLKEKGVEDKDVELKIRRADGKIIEVIFSLQILEIDGKMSHVYGLVDITERKKTEQKLKEVNKELDSFTYSVSHDLRAPLRAISGYTRILKEDYGNLIDAEGKRIMNVISNNAQKMGQLIDDLLAFSRLGRQNIVSVPIDMNSLVRSIKDDLIAFSDLKNIQIDIRNLIIAIGDSSMIKVVMTNLLSNAIKYSSKKDEIIIEVGSYYEGKNIVYYVKDKGAGFDMQYYDKLFGVFQRLHSTSEFEGTGVGLAIVQRIINKHGGKVWAESKIDIGSTFYFSLPKV
jgi:PAS domain S-box-containing protein